jgi:hypothetical protein
MLFDDCDPYHLLFQTGSAVALRLVKVNCNAFTCLLANEIRTKKGLPVIYATYCNAHARRQSKDRDSNEVNEDAESMIKKYQEIYRLNAEAKNQSPEVIQQKRSHMMPVFEAMKEEALQKINSYSGKSQVYTAYNYFIKNFDGLTIFLTNYLIPIDNNQS